MGVPGWMTLVVGGGGQGRINAQTRYGSSLGASTSQGAKWVKHFHLLLIILSIVGRLHLHLRNYDIVYAILS